MYEQTTTGCLIYTRTPAVCSHRRLTVKKFCRENVKISRNDKLLR